MSLAAPARVDPFTAEVICGYGLVIHQRGQREYVLDQAATRGLRAELDRHMAGRPG